MSPSCAYRLFEGSGHTWDRRRTNDSARTAAQHDATNNLLAAHSLQPTGPRPAAGKGHCLQHVTASHCFLFLVTGYPLSSNAVCPFRVLFLGTSFTFWRPALQLFLAIKNLPWRQPDIGSNIPLKWQISLINQWQVSANRPFSSSRRLWAKDLLFVEKKINHNKLEIISCFSPCLIRYDTMTTFCNVPSVFFSHLP